MKIFLNTSNLNNPKIEITPTYKITSYKNTNGVKIYTIEKNGTPLMQCSDYNIILQKYNKLTN